MPRLLSLLSRPVVVPQWLQLFYLLSWFHMLFLTSGYMTLGLSGHSAGSALLFHITAWGFYSALYLIPVVAVGWLLSNLGKTSRIAALLVSITCLLLIYVDSIIYKLYAFHINGFVLNLVFTPGGISSLGGSSETYISAGLLVTRIVAIQAAVLAASQWATKRRPRMNFSPSRFAVAALTLFMVQGSVYGVSDISKDGAVLDSAHVYPFFQRVRFRSLAKKIGFKPAVRNTLQATVDSSRLNYPRALLSFSAIKEPPNIILLVAESLRWDQLTPQIMPNTWSFAQQNNRFEQHYSSGNGTREALFGMFYGLYGSYWENFLTARRAPVLMERIQDMDYRLDLRTSARFTYPEFDKTLFAKVPADKLQEADGNLPPWQRDQVNTDQLTAFLSQQHDETPFFSFFFLESTHASYSFPEDSAVAKPYLAAMDYANISLENLKAERTELINRYSNAAHWIDAQLGRIYKTLEKQGLLDNTIVIVTGDHGEEFLEHGAWGHNSSFVQQQTHVPMVVHWPGKQSQTFTRVTSHMDIATTLLETLGIENRKEEFSLGSDLFDDTPRSFITLSDWHSISVLTNSLKYRIPYINRGINWSPTDNLDHPLPSNKVAATIAQNRQMLLTAMENCTLFSRIAGEIQHKDSSTAMAGNP